MNTKITAGAFAAVLLSMLLMGLLGGVASAQTAVSACQTLSSSGNYFLTTNLTATGSCLVIGADNVAIDLKGKTITGGGSDAGITDSGVARDDVIIANGKITNFANGVDLAASGHAIITNLTVSNNSSNGIFIKGCCNTLSSITANSNGGAGIYVNSDDSNFTDIQASGNTGPGLDATECCNTVIGSTLSNNTGGGVNIGDGDDFVIASKVENNSSNGVVISGGTDGVVTSTITGNSGDGVNLSSSDNMVTESTVSKNTADGIDLGGTYGIISGVTAQSNGADGVNMLCYGSTASLNAISNASADLVQTVDSGPCANVDLFAP